MNETQKTVVVIPNWNGEDFLSECIDSLLAQSVLCDVVVVDNGSVDSSRSIIGGYGDKVIPLYNDTNLGFAGGVNTGIRYALEKDYYAVALFNNDAVADKDWLRHLTEAMRDGIGIVTCAFLSMDGEHIDSTGDIFTTWGLPYPRGRDKAIDEISHDGASYIFGASGGDSLYRVKMLREIGLFDEDFFAYFEDVDLSFRAQLANWKAVVTTDARAYHRISATSSRIKGFATYHSLKNWPLTIIKNVPKGLLPIVVPRFLLAYLMFIGSSVVVHRHPLLTIEALWKVLTLLPKKAHERRAIQSAKRVSNEYLLSIMTQDLPENATKLRKLRQFWWTLKGKGR